VSGNDDRLSPEELERAHEMMREAGPTLYWKHGRETPKPDGSRMTLDITHGAEPATPAAWRRLIDRLTKRPERRDANRAQIRQRYDEARTYWRRQGVNYPSDKEIAGKMDVDPRTVRRWRKDGIID